MTHDSERLRTLASADGLSWAEDVRGALALEGRRPVGMWPGTLTEARARATRIMQVRALGGSPDLREHLARAVYRAARGGWLLGREPEPIDELDD